VLATDEVDIGTVPGRFEDFRNELHEAAGLAVALVFLEEGDDVLDGRMERIGAVDLFGDLFCALCDGFRAGGFGQGCRVG
jgi:hypothetical protein